MRYLLAVILSLSCYTAVFASKIEVLTDEGVQTVVPYDDILPGLIAERDNAQSVVDAWTVRRDEAQAKINAYGAKKEAVAIAVAEAVAVAEAAKPVTIEVDGKPYNN